jgi:hypothetical protein
MRRPGPITSGEGLAITVGNQNIRSSRSHRLLTAGCPRCSETTRCERRYDRGFPGTNLHSCRSRRHAAVDMHTLVSWAAGTEQHRHSHKKQRVVATEGGPIGSRDFGTVNAYNAPLCSNPRICCSTCRRTWHGCWKCEHFAARNAAGDVSGPGATGFLVPDVRHPRSLYAGMRLSLREVDKRQRIGCKSQQCARHRRFEFHRSTGFREE